MILLFIFVILIDLVESNPRYGKVTFINGSKQMVQVHLRPSLTWAHYESRTNQTLRSNPKRPIGFNRVPWVFSDVHLFSSPQWWVNTAFTESANPKSAFRPNRKRDIYYPLLHEDGRGSIQMMTVMDMNSNTLVLDEIVLQDHAYRLEQFGEDFFLPPNGKF